ncbi:hypothetical protein [Pseudorhodobacter aquimaris]|uniref:hypothetical protein n=1 Tax=Pseudorhodobacter aquimaris TaxID=687412 RepID=UPI00067C9D42|nr:hypothetical protein [Pseudorhodobacter aquimaris]
MFIAESGISDGTPADVKEIAEQAMQEARTASRPRLLMESTDEVDYGTPHSGTQPLVGADLELWDVQAHQYRSEIGGKVDLLARLFSTKGRVVLQGVVQEAKRYRILVGENGVKTEIGCAVRLTAATSSQNFSAKLTIPNLAASAQLDYGKSDVRIALSVSGFCGPLGDLIPSPAQLSVENFAEYMQAFANIQKYVFGESALHYLRPVHLGYHSATPEDNAQ